MKIRKVNHIPSQTHSFLSLVTYVHISSSPIYRQTEGIIKATGKSLPDHPSYGHICKRINRLSVDIKKDDDWADSDDDLIIIAADSTGVKVTNRGQWMSDKWGLGKKGYLKIHIAVDIKTKEILALELTDEKVHDSKMMKKLVKHVLNNNNTTTTRRRQNKIHSFI
jgi:Transposase DDE domain